ncbi:hypothetical protein PMAYCL1PPCAC_01206, partial [Pristionchus mayeri]
WLKIMAAFFYSTKYKDDNYEYMEVHAPKEVIKLIPNIRLMSEAEWRSLGIQQTRGWENYKKHPTERHVLLFRRLLPKNPLSTGNGDQKEKVMEVPASVFFYSPKHEDDVYEFRHVQVSKKFKEVLELIPKDRLMNEEEWRGIGIEQSPGWEHYMIHPLERHILLFRRPLLKKPLLTGIIDEKATNSSSNQKNEQSKQLTEPTDLMAKSDRKPDEKVSSKQFERSEGGGEKKRQRSTSEDVADIPSPKHTPPQES